MTAPKPTLKLARRLAKEKRGWEVYERVYCGMSQNFVTLVAMDPACGPIDNLYKIGVATTYTQHFKDEKLAALAALCAALHALPDKGVTR